MSTAVQNVDCTEWIQLVVTVNKLLQFMSH